MSPKKLLFVIIISVLLAIAYVYAGKIFTPSQKVMSPVVNMQVSAPPKPTAAPITENSNLEEEILKLQEPDYSQDFSKLRTQIQQF